MGLEKESSTHTTRISSSHGNLILRIQAIVSFLFSTVKFSIRFENMDIAFEKCVRMIKMWIN